MRSVFFDFEAIASSSYDWRSMSLSWPVSSTHFREFRQPLISAFFEFLNQVPQQARDIIFADTNFFVFFLQLVHFNLANTMATDYGLQIRSSSRSLQYLDPDWRKVANVHREYFKDSGPLHRSLIQPIKRARRMLIHRSDFPQSLFRHVLGRSMPVMAVGVHGAEHDLQRNFFSSSGDYFSFWDWRDFRCLGNEARAEYEGQRTHLQQFVSEFLAWSSSHLARYGVKLDKDNITQVWLHRLRHVAQIYYSALEIVIPLDRATVIGENDVMRKPVVLALQHRGIPFTGFLHGDTISGLYKQFDAISISRSHVPRIIAPNNNNARLQQTLYCTGNTYSHKSVRYEGLSFGGSEEPVTPRDSPNTLSIILVGWPMNLQRYFDDENSFFLPKFELERQIISTVQEWGVPIAYLPHPDRGAAVHRLYKTFGIPVLSESIENLVGQYSVFAFTHPTTSAFGKLLKTSNSILLFDSADHLWTPQGRYLIDQRCHRILTPDLDNGGTFFDPDQLSHVLELCTNCDEKRVNRELYDIYYSGSLTFSPIESLPRNIN